MRPIGSLTALLCVASAAGAILSAQGVEVALADRAPRFLMPSPSGGAPVVVDTRSVPALWRRISVDLDDVTLEQALNTVSREAGLKLMYSKAVVPLDNRVHLQASNITVAGALIELLLDAGVDVLLARDGQLVLVKSAQGGTVAGRVTDAKSGKGIPNASVYLEGTRWRATTGEDGAYRLVEVTAGTYTLTASRIGYAKQSQSVTVAAGQEVTADVVLSAAATELEQVVVTGPVVPTEQRAIPTPISVVTAEDIQKQNLQRLDQIFRGGVPGAIAWDQGPGYDYYGNIAVRGASSLGTLHTIKTLIDGVEVANSFDIATIDPNSVDRIEITRGPQASTLYGAGALDGVMQIFTKKGSVGLTRPDVIAKISAGGVGGFDGSSTAFQTDNALSVLGGGENGSYNLGGSYRHGGESVPSYQLTDWNISAGGQTIQGQFTLSSFARYAALTADAPWDTRFQSYSFLSRPPYLTNRLRQQTYGVTAILEATPNWHHTLTLGYDQSYYSNAQTQPRFTTPADSFLTASTQHEGKVSLLYHTDLSLELGAAVAATLTAGANYDTYDFASSYTTGATQTTGNLNGSTSAGITEWTNRGYFGQIQLAVSKRLFFTGGLRAEQDPNFGPELGTAWSPRLGAAYVVRLGQATVKLRASYGESIRAPDFGTRNGQVTPNFVKLANPALAPERQRGADGGVEVYVGRTSLGVSYYSQRTIDLIQFVVIPDTIFTFQFQNLARVKNEGWEFEWHLPLGPVHLTGTYSITNSTVQRLPAAYAGDYRVGDRILGIPHTSGGATVTYSPVPGTTLTGGVTFIGHWTNTDQVALYGFYFGGQPYRGSGRAYWMTYPTVTKFSLGVNQTVTEGLTAFLRAENAGNTLRFEQDNLHIPRPRSVIVGANVRF